MQYTPQCMICKHLVVPAEDTTDPYTCLAFPGGIPDALLKNEVDHREEMPGDNGVRWVPETPGLQHPGILVVPPEARTW